MFREEKCAICHIYDSKYFDETVIPEKDPLERERRMCFSCHLGAVDDLGKKLLAGSHHPTVSVMRKSLKTGRRRKVEGCSVCHTPHTEIGWEGFAGTSLSIYMGGEKICVSCHTLYGDNGEGNHHKYGDKEACLTCHTMHGGWGKALLKDSYQRLCLRCHEPVKEMFEKGKGHPVGKVVREPVMILGEERVGEPEVLNLSCSLCHDMHVEGSEKGLLSMDPEKLCRSCHEGYVGSGTGMENNGNHPASVSCMECHEVHSYARKDEKGSATLCLSCHSDKSGGGENHPASKKAGGRFGCLGCHSLHRGVVGTSNLRKRNDTFCLECHEKYNTLNEKVSPPLSHPVFVEIADSKKRAGLQERGGVFGKFGEMICRTCHSVHRGEKKGLLIASSEVICAVCHGKKEIVHGSKDLSCAECHAPHGIRDVDSMSDSEMNPVKFVCLKCHGEKSGHPEVIDVRGGSKEKLPLFNNRGEEAYKGYVTCPTCHDPHGGSENADLLRKPYEGVSFLCLSCHRDKEGITLTPHDLRFIVSENLCEPCHEPHFGGERFMWGMGEGDGKSMKEMLCISCHTPGGLAEPVDFGEGHPVDIIPSVKKGIPLPFFDSFWRKNELGMVTCPTCHNVHGENISAIPDQRQGLLNLRYSFGDQEGFIERRNFCVICHVEKKGMKLGPHGKKRCEDCHMIHVSGKEKGVPPLPDLCVECHNDVPEREAFVFEILGKKKPEDMHVSEKAVFLMENGRLGTDGVVSCPSCHDPHASSADSKKSFVGGNPSAPCLLCHPEKAQLKGSPHDLDDENLCGECHGMCLVKFTKNDMKEITEDFGANPADAKCIFCHSDFADEGFYFTHPKKVTPVKSSYGATVFVGSDVVMVSKLPGSSSVKYPLFDENGRMRESGTLGCRTCHDPHLENKIEDKETYFLRDSSGLFISYICLPCHGSDARDHVLKFHSLKRKEYD